MGEINLKKHSKQLQAFLTKIITIRILVPGARAACQAIVHSTTPGMQTEDPEFKIGKKNIQKE